MAAHVRYGFRKRPSDASRWTRCPGALAFTQDYPNESSEFADEGTVAHTVREMCLDLGFDAYDFIGQKRKLNDRVWEVDDEMADFLQPGIDEIREFTGQLFIERWVDTTEWVGPDENGKPQGGTLDCGVVGTDLIVISDLKYGRGIAVQAVDNDQQILYALAFWSQIARHISGATQFLIIIDQPRNSAGGGYWQISLEELLKRGEKIKEAAEKADSDEPELIATLSGCKWCPAANVPGRPGGCPAHAKANLDPVQIDFEDLDAPDAWEPPLVEDMTPERLINLSLHRKDIEKFLEWAHAKAIQHLMDYGPSGGQKAVYGRRPPRKFVNTDGAEAYMKQTLPSRDPFNKKLKSPSQVEKEMGKGYAIPQALIEQGSPKPTMVPVEDKREAIKPMSDEIEDLGADEFDNLEDL